MEAKKNPSKDLHRQSTKFFLIGLCISSALAITAFEWRTEKKEILINSVEPLTETIIDVKSTVHEPPKPQPIPIQKITSAPVKQETLGDIIPTDDNLPEPDISIDPDFIKYDSGLYRIPDEPTTEIFTSPEVFPEPVGGYKEFYSTLSQNLKYPKQAQRSHTEGKVFVEFVIDKKGNVTDIKTVKGIGNGCDEEAIRVLTKTHWLPGKQRGIPVKVRMTLPINFKLQ